MNVIAELTL